METAIDYTSESFIVRQHQAQVKVVEIIQEISFGFRIPLLFDPLDVLNACIEGNIEKFDQAYKFDQNKLECQNIGLMMVIACFHGHKALVDHIFDTCILNGMTITNIYSFSWLLMIHENNKTNLRKLNDFTLIMMMEYACIFDNEEIADYLIQIPNVQYFKRIDGKYSKPVQFAIEKGSNEIMKRFLVSKIMLPLYGSDCPDVLKNVMRKFKDPNLERKMINQLEVKMQKFGFSVDIWINYRDLS